MTDNFREALFPEGVAYGSSGGPKLKTTIFTSDSGYEQRNIDWSAIKSEFDVGQAVKDADKMEELTSFFYAVAQGKSYGFRFKDWADYTITDQIIGFGDGETKDFQIIKTYTVTQAESGESYTFTRPLSKINWGSIENLKIGASVQVEDTDFTVDYDTGLVSFTTAPAHYSLIQIERGEFHVPCRFDTDHLDATHDTYATQSWQNIPVIEIRPRVDPTVVTAIPLPPPTPPPTYLTQGVFFDGLTSIANAALVATDTKYFTWSFWFRFTSTRDTWVTNFPAWWVSDPAEYSNYSNFDSNVVNFSRSAGTHNWFYFSNNDNYDVDGVWHHCIVSTDGTADAFQGALLIDGVVIQTAGGPTIDQTAHIDCTPIFNALEMLIGDDSYEDPLTAQVADFWMSTEISVVVGNTIPTINLRKFYNPDTGKPVDLGADGSTPGIVPTIYLRVDPVTGVADDFLTNRGSGGNFTYVGGALTLSDTNPSD